MRKFLKFVGRHPYRTVTTIGLVALMFHWGYFGFLLLSVPTLAVWRDLLP